MAGETLIDTQPAGTPENLPAPSPISFPPIAQGSLFESSKNVSEIFAALAVAQGQIEQPKKTKKATVKGESRGQAYSYSYWYCDIADVLNACNKAYSENGIAVLQFPTIEQKDYEAGRGNEKVQMKGAMVFVRTVLAHKSGQWIGNSIHAMAESMGPQAIGSVITYLRRYGLQLIGGIAADEDEDGGEGQGNQAGGAGDSQQSKPQGEPQRNGPANGATWDVTDTVIDYKKMPLGGGRNRHSITFAKAGLVICSNEDVGNKIGRENQSGFLVKVKLRKAGRDVEMISGDVVPPSGAAG